MAANATSLGLLGAKIASRDKTDSGVQVRVGYHGGAALPQLAQSFLFPPASAREELEPVTRQALSAFTGPHWPVSLTL